MCEFFSFLITRSGDILYHDAKQRKQMRKSDDNPDSHAMIARTYKVSEDQCIKFEYSPGALGVRVDHVPDWAEAEDAPGIAPEHLEKAKRFATRFDFRELFKQWPKDISKLKTMSIVRVVPRKLSPAVMRCVKALAGKEMTIEKCLPRYEHAPYYVIQKVRNTSSCMAGALDSLRAIKKLGWMNLFFKKGTKQRKLMDMVLVLIDAGVNPRIEQISPTSWTFRSARTGRQYVVTSTGRTGLAP